MITLTSRILNWSYVAWLNLFLIIIRQNRVSLSQNAQNHSWLAAVIWFSHDFCLNFLNHVRNDGSGILTRCASGKITYSLNFLIHAIKYKIIASYLKLDGPHCKWFDCRNLCLQTSVCDLLQTFICYTKW